MSDFRSGAQLLASATSFPPDIFAASDRSASSDIRSHTAGFGSHSHCGTTFPMFPQVGITPIRNQGLDAIRTERDRKKPLRCPLQPCRTKTGFCCRSTSSEYHSGNIYGTTYETARGFTTNRFQVWCRDQNILYNAWTAPLSPLKDRARFSMCDK